MPLGSQRQQIEIDLLPGSGGFVGFGAPVVLQPGEGGQGITGNIQCPALGFEGGHDKAQRIVAQGAAFHLQEHGFQQQADKAHPLVHLGAACLREDILIPLTLQDGINIVGLTIFLIEFVVDGKIPGDLLVLQLLSGQLLADCKAQLLVILQDLGKVLPGTGRYHGQTVHGGLDLVKILGTDIQIADDAAADTVFQRIGLPRFIRRPGLWLQPEPDYRPDVVSFVSVPLKKALTICGQIKVHLNVATDVDDTAFTAKLMEVFPDGRAYNIRGGITTIAADLPEGQVYTPGQTAKVCVEMWDMNWTVQPGSCLRLDISSSDFPQYAVHSNYAGVWSEQGKTRIAHQKILLGEGSFVELPLHEN